MLYVFRLFILHFLYRVKLLCQRVTTKYLIDPIVCVNVLRLTLIDNQLLVDLGFDRLGCKAITDV
jgi:hypothetical protein